MILQILVLSVAILGVLAIGAPLVTRLATVSLRRRAFADTYDPGTRVVVTHTPRIEPLDLGPDLTKWPSESGRGTPYVEKLAWPSASWDDDAFGRRGATEAAEASRRSTEAQLAVAKEARRKATERPVRPASKPATPRAPAKAKAPPKEPPAPADAGLPFDPRHAAGLIRQHGLGGAVSRLSDETGMGPDEVMRILVSFRR